MSAALRKNDQAGAENQELLLKVNSSLVPHFPCLLAHVNAATSVAALQAGPAKHSRPRLQLSHVYTVRETVYLLAMPFEV